MRFTKVPDKVTNTYYYSYAAAPLIGMRFFYLYNPRRKPFQGSPGRIKTYAATILSPRLLSRSRRLEGFVIAVLDDS